jgi:transcriptional regulator with XRE-family HTH domain
MSKEFQKLPLIDGRIALDQQCLKALRKALGLSQEAMADLCSEQHLCVSLASIKRAEAGKAVLYRTARHIARFFQIKLTRIARSIGGEDRLVLPWQDNQVKVVPLTITRDQTSPTPAIQYGNWG